MENILIKITETELTEGLLKPKKKKKTIWQALPQKDHVRVRVWVHPKYRYACGTDLALRSMCFETSVMRRQASRKRIFTTASLKSQSEKEKKRKLGRTYFGIKRVPTVRVFVPNQSNEKSNFQSTNTFHNGVKRSPRPAEACELKQNKKKKQRQQNI